MAAVPATAVGGKSKWNWPFLSTLLIPTILTILIGTIGSACGKIVCKMNMTSKVHGNNINLTSNFHRNNINLTTNFHRINNGRKSFKRT